MSATFTAIELAGVGVCATAVAYLTDAPPQAQDYTVLGLLSVVVVGIGRWMVQAIKEGSDKTAAAMDRNTEAQSRTATALALLIQESKEARAEGAQKRAEILAKLDHIQHHKP